ncbi:terminase small subunit [Clostridium paraputrificum]|uniref:terminase small subunit n=1 Tax=Clostridium paraputrificum TaxID=29363 RepID=UPI0006688F27|nr:terminase small subunit [Clostridium paraputrificum]MDB2075637.1 terminase small subunit [Clostridium paraputrificum]MDB2079903.1 terminase small subunit [Clostridium paraputrificum]
MAKLTEKQKRFVEEYLIDLNATQAAIRAGYSPNTAKDIGCENLAKPNIRACIDKEIAERSKRTGINQDRVIRELARLAFVNANDVIDMEEAKLKDGATEDDTAAIASVKVKTIPTKEGEGIEREIKLTDKLKALELLGKHLGMFKDKVEIDATVKSTAKLDSILSQLGDEEE